MLLPQGVGRLVVGGCVPVLDERWREAAILQQRQGLPRLAAARVVIDGDGHRPSSSSMPCCWPQEGAAGSRSSRAPRKLPLTNFQASWGQSATMLKHLAIFLCYAGGAAALAFYGPQWLPEGPIGRAPCRERGGP